MFVGSVSSLKSGQPVRLSKRENTSAVPSFSGVESMKAANPVHQRSLARRLGTLLMLPVAGLSAAGALTSCSTKEVLGPQIPVSPTIKAPEKAFLKLWTILAPDAVASLSKKSTSTLDASLSAVSFVEDDTYTNIWRKISATDTTLKFDSHSVDDIGFDTPSIDTWTLNSDGSFSREISFNSTCKDRFIMGTGSVTWETVRTSDNAVIQRNLLIYDSASGTILVRDINNTETTGTMKDLKFNDAVEAVSKAFKKAKDKLSKATFGAGGNDPLSPLKNVMPQHINRKAILQKANNVASSIVKNALRRV